MERPGSLDHEAPEKRMAGAPQFHETAVARVSGSVFGYREDGGDPRGGGWSSHTALGGGGGTHGTADRYQDRHFRIQEGPDHDGEGGQRDEVDIDARRDGSSPGGKTGGENIHHPFREEEKGQRQRAKEKEIPRGQPDLADLPPREAAPFRQKEGDRQGQGHRTHEGEHLAVPPGRSR